MPGKPSVFRSRQQPAAAEAERAYDSRRGSARARGYTAAWDRAAAAFKREQPLCLGCLAIGRVEPTAVVDHSRPHKGDQLIFWDRSRWQPACQWHHDVVKQILEQRWERSEASESDLRLDSAMAKALTLELRG